MEKQMLEKLNECKLNAVDFVSNQKFWEIWKQLYPEYQENEQKLLLSGFNVGYRYRDRHIRTPEQLKAQWRVGQLVAGCMMLLDKFASTDEGKEMTDKDFVKLQIAFCFDNWEYIGMYCFKIFKKLRNKLNNIKLNDGE